MTWLDKWRKGGKQPASALRKRTILRLEELERRDNPAVPASLLDVSLLSLGSVPSGGYAETHTPHKSFSHVITLDESGTANSGTYTLDILGSANATDTASGGGGGA